MAPHEFTSKLIIGRTDLLRVMDGHSSSQICIFHKGSCCPSIPHKFQGHKPGLAAEQLHELLLTDLVSHVAHKQRAAGRVVFGVGDLHRCEMLLINQPALIDQQRHCRFAGLQLIRARQYYVLFFADDLKHSVCCLPVP